ncbi:MAG: flagellar assembly protein FliW [Dehalococcoidia bacterium]|nr:MAG: flagellar assembly protein FliW [Dehalococcoidia bacterium]
MCPGVDRMEFEMRVTTTLLGAEETLEVSEEQIFAFEPGLGGFESLRRFALVREQDSPVEWLVSLEDPDVSFAVLEPFLFQADYAFELPDREVEALGMHEPGDAMIRCLLTLNEDPEQITANLLAPLVFSRRTHMARQMILSESTFSLRTKVFAAAAVEEPLRATA